jgi:hypothetical protein
MVSSLDQQFALIQASGRHGLWLDHTAFTKRVLLPDGGIPYDTPASFMSYYIQANGLVKPDVAILDVQDIYRDWLRLNPVARTEMAGKKRLVFALKKMLEAPAPKTLLAEIILAVLSHLNGRLPVVLVLPSPRHWLAWANVEANGVEPELTEDSIGDASVYLADFIRYFSELELTGLLLTEQAGHQPASEAEVELYRPLLNVAAHYRWSVGLQLPEPSSLGFCAGISFIIAPGFQQAAPDLAGVDVGGVIWQGQAPPLIQKNQFYFTNIPEHEPPEHVLTVLSALRQPSRLIDGGPL